MPLYAVYFPGMFYNCEESSYDLTPLPDSIIKNGKVFACNKSFIPADDHNGTLALAVEFTTEPDDKTRYKSIERLKNLICLSYDVVPNDQRLETTASTVDEVVAANLSERFYNPDVRYGSQLTWDLPMRVAAYTQLVAATPVEKRERFWRALQTYAYARLIAQQVNPQYKYTLYMSLHLASIDQLADNPQNKHGRGDKLTCPVCGELPMTHNTSHVDEIEKLMRELIEPDRIDIWLRLAKKLYHPVRSNWVHDGTFAGFEDIGGHWSMLGDEAGKELAENDINLMILNKMLLEKYLQASQQNVQTT